MGSAEVRKMRSPITTGDDQPTPATADFHTTCDVALQACGRFFASEWQGVDPALGAGQGLRAGDLAENRGILLVRSLSEQADELVRAFEGLERADAFVGHGWSVVSGGIIAHSRAFGDAPAQCRTSPGMAHLAAPSRFLAPGSSRWVRSGPTTSTR
jgi:hypothetical protein